jgi:eukaryotic-like serine/threonine-protein kinase
MGEVYRARDSRLGRDIALKVLPSGLSLDPERLQRFEQEARAVATLNHPNILAVHDVGRHQGQPYIVTELLVGETLRERLSSGAIPLRKALDYALQIAHGLAAAHDKGLVHRDLKPENLFVTHDDRLKILDFGLAKAVDSARSDAHTISAERLTAAGAVLGTVGYMAPEQVRCEAVDHRADLFAFGCVVHEMISGSRAFSAQTPADTMSAILAKEPADLEAIGGALPPALVRIVRRCLEKSQALRFQSAQDLAFALENATTPSSAASGSLLSRAPRPAWATRLFPLLVALAAGAVIGAAVVARLAPHGGVAGSVVLGRTIAVTRESGLELHPTLSPDGALVAYAAGPSDQMHIYVRQVSGGRAIDVTPTLEGSFGHPRWSHDGSRILFAGSTGAYVVPALGGVARRVLERVGIAEWSPDSTEIAYTTEAWTGRPAHIHAQPLDGSASRTVTDSPVMEPNSLAWSPDGRFIAFVSGNGTFLGPGRLVGNVSPSRIMVVEAAGGTAVAVTPGDALATSPTWTHDSAGLLFVSNVFGTRDLFEVAIAGDGRPEGEPHRLTAGLNAHTVSVSRHGGRLAYATLTLSSNIWSIPVPREPPISIREATPVTAGHQVIEGLALSRDGRWLAFDSNVSGNQDIYRLRLPDGEPEQLTTDPADEFEPSWSPDGKQIVFHAWPRGNRDLFVIGVDGHGRQDVTTLPGHEWFPDWSPDGSRIAFVDSNAGGVSVVLREGTGWSAPKPLYTDALTTPIFAPDGRTFVRTPLRSYDSGDLQIAPAVGGPLRTLLRGPVPGTTVMPASARWSADGRLVYFLGIDRQGRSSFWSIPAAGGAATLIVSFDDPTRESNRSEFTTDGARLYFTLAQKEGGVWVMEIARR